MSFYRFTLRFDLEDEKEREAAGILKSIREGSRKDFVINTILSSSGSMPSFSPDDLRTILREELCALFAGSAPPLPAGPLIQDAEDPEDEGSILDDLKLFE